MIEKHIELAKILATENVASLLTEDDRKKIAESVLQTYQHDLSSLQSVFTFHERYIKMYTQQKLDEGLSVESKSAASEYPGKAHSSYPLIYRACQTFTSLAFPALVKSNSVFKCGVVGNDSDISIKQPESLQDVPQQAQGDGEYSPPEDMVNQQSGEAMKSASGGKKKARANRVTDFINYLLFNRVDNFVDDFDRQLTAQALLGYMISKVYYNPVLKKIVRDVLYPQSVVFNIEAKSFDTNTITQEINMSLNDVYENIKREVWDGYTMEELLEEEKSPSTDGKRSESSSQDITYTFPMVQYRKYLEQHTWLDLDGDGYYEPYIVIIDSGHKGGTIVNITKRFNKDSVVWANNKKSDVLNIKPQLFFFLYPFENNADGSLGGIGYGNIMGNTQESVNALLSSVVEGSLKANMNIYIASAGISKTNNIILGDNSILSIKNSMGARLQESIMPLPRVQPSPVSFQLLDYLINAGTQLQHAANISPEALMQTSATAVMSGIEEGLRAFKAVYKRTRNVLSGEALAYFNIIKDHKDDFKKIYKEVLDDDRADFNADFNADDLDIQPTADVDAVTKTEKMAEATFLMNMMQLPNVNGFAIIKRVMEAAGVENYSDLLIEPRPNEPTPQEAMLQQQQQLAQQQIQNDQLNAQVRAAEMNQKGAELELKGLETESKIELNRAKAIQAVSDAESKEAGIQIDSYRAQVDGLAKNVNNNKKVVSNE